MVIIVLDGHFYPGQRQANLASAVPIGDQVVGVDRALLCGLTFTQVKSTHKTTKPRGLLRRPGAKKTHLLRIIKNT